MQKTIVPIDNTQLSHRHRQPIQTNQLQLKIRCQHLEFALYHSLPTEQLQLIIEKVLTYDSHTH